MRKQSVRTTIDIPTDLYRRLKEQAALRGSSARKLILHGIEGVLLQREPPHNKRVKFPLIRSVGPKVELTNERLYEYAEFP